MSQRFAKPRKAWQGTISWTGILVHSKIRLSNFWVGGPGSNSHSWRSSRLWTQQGREGRWWVGWVMLMDMGCRPLITSSLQSPAPTPKPSPLSSPPSNSTPSQPQISFLKSLASIRSRVPGLPSTWPTNENNRINRLIPLCETNTSHSTTSNYSSQSKAERRQDMKLSIRYMLIRLTRKLCDYRQSLLEVRAQS